MALQSILAVRIAIDFTITSGQALHLVTPDGAWSVVAVDYGNLGAETTPPTRAYINQVDDTEVASPTSAGHKISMMLPLSAEGVLAPSVGGSASVQFRRPIAYQAAKIFQG